MFINFIQKLKIVFQDFCTELNKHFRNNTIFVKRFFINNNVNM